jgi:hypothetical protein
MACIEIHVTHSEAEATAFRLQFHIRKQPLLERSAAAALPLPFSLFGVPTEHRRFVHRPEEAARVISVSNGHTMSGFSGLEVACWPLVPVFAGSNPAEAVGFFGRKNPQHAFLRRGSKAVCPISCFTACLRTQK